MSLTIIKRDKQKIKRQRLFKFHTFWQPAIKLKLTGIVRKIKLFIERCWWALSRQKLIIDLVKLTLIILVTLVTMLVTAKWVYYIVI